MTPAELTVLIEAYEWRQLEDWRKVTFQTAMICNHWRKQGHFIDPEDLMPKRKEDKKTMTDEEMATGMINWALAFGAEDKRKFKGEYSWQKND